MFKVLQVAIDNNLHQLEIGYLATSKMSLKCLYTVNDKNIGVALMSNELQKIFSLRGQGNKTHFDQYTNIINLIYNICLEAEKKRDIYCPTKKEVFTALGDFLKNAPKLLK
ncbi:hypothetical protein ACFFRR_007549 [Megaselia abdita]